MLEEEEEGEGKGEGGGGDSGDLGGLSSNKIRPPYMKLSTTSESNQGTMVFVAKNFL